MDKIATKGLVRHTSKHVPAVKTKMDGKSKEVAVIPRPNVRPKHNTVPLKTSLLRQRETDLAIPAGTSTKHKKNMLDKVKKSGDQCQPEFNSLITRSVNFPQTKAVYKNLIPLSNETLIKCETYARPSEEMQQPPTDLSPKLPGLCNNTAKRQYYYLVQMSSSQRRSAVKFYRGDKEYQQHAYFI